MKGLCLQIVFIKKPQYYMNSAGNVKIDGLVQSMKLSKAPTGRHITAQGVATKERNPGLRVINQLSAESATDSGAPSGLPYGGDRSETQGLPATGGPAPWATMCEPFRLVWSSRMERGRRRRGHEDMKRGHPL